MPLTQCPPDQRFRLKPDFGLKPTDTCDRCGPGTQALVLVVHPEHGELRFCNHCFTRHEPALVAQGFTVADSTEVPA
jgi:hypothetical protein